MKKGLVDRVGELRPSQLLWAFGIGAVVDLSHFSVVVQGLDDWMRDRCSPIGEERLLRAVKRRLGPQVERLAAPPMPPDPDRPFDPFTEEARIGVPVTPFPQWFRCPLCHRLAPLESGLFSFEMKNPYRPDSARWVHTNCDKGNAPTVVPARFVVACSKGHVDDFPWRYFAHRGRTDCKGQLEFYEVGASLETANLFVECKSCDAPRRSMAEAFDREKNSLPACRGRHPHLGQFEEDCDRPLRTLNLGASNGWFPKR